MVLFFSSLEMVLQGFLSKANGKLRPRLWHPDPMFSIRTLPELALMNQKNRWTSKTLFTGRAKGFRFLHIHQSSSLLLRSVHDHVYKEQVMVVVSGEANVEQMDGKKKP
ncbi:hypothetical protein NFI96_023274 [Prochilodus magdalenae]|nr:hypothetical protein NFI96_023274 [Prochilodus magdalenae]